MPSAAIVEHLFAMIANIQTLRFIAALAVVLYHVQFHVVAAGEPGAHLFSALGAFGYFGVDVFFVISGFIMWHTSSGITGAAWGLDFAYRRATRIYTGYWPYFFIALVVALLFQPQSLVGKDLWGSFLLTKVPIRELLIPVSWTLSFELYFYALFTLLILFPQRLRLWLLGLLLLWVLLVQGHALLNLGGYHRETFSEVSMLYRFFASPLLLEFIAGSALAAWYQGFRPPAWLLFGLSLGMLWAALAYQAGLPEHSLAPGYYAPQRVALLGSAALLLVWAAVALEQEGWVPLPRWGLFLGAISYSLYLSHTIILLLVEWSGLRTFISHLGQVPLWYLLVVLVMLIYSAAHYVWIETPLRHLSRRLRQLYLKKLDMKPDAG